MNDIIVHLHSGLRWVSLVLLLLAIFNAFTAKEFKKPHQMINLFTMVTLHTQLLIGLYLYFQTVTFSPGWMKDPVLRFYGMEHVLGMVIALTFITLGYVKSKKGGSAQAKFKPIRLWYVLGFILILAFIPWPFRNLCGHWF
jgi:NADH:ubiquinone oxidoreductase subunit 2 (subunit N)